MSIGVWIKEGSVMSIAVWTLKVYLSPPDRDGRKDEARFQFQVFQS